MFNEELFYNRLAELRLSKNVSARDMSLSLGQCENYVNNIENKRNFPSMQVFFYICDYFGISPMEFFDFEAKSPSKLKDLTDKMKSLNNEQLTLIENMIDQMKK